MPIITNPYMLVDPTVVVPPEGAPVSWNPSDKANTVTLSNSNKTATIAPAGATSVRGTVGKSTGKWYYEVLVGGGEFNMIGLGRATSDIDSYPGSDSTSVGYYSNGTKFGGNDNGSAGASYATGDRIGVAIDADTGTVRYYKNGAQQGNPAVVSTGFAYFPMVGNGGGGNPTILTLQDTPTYPVSGYTQWSGT